MNQKRKKKITQLAKYMNQKSLIRVPLISPIINCFDILLDNQQLDFLLQLEDKKFTYQDLKELYLEDDVDSFLYPIMHYGMIWCIHDRYELSPIFPGWIEICLSGPLDEKKKLVLETFKDFEDFLKLVNLPGVRQYLNYNNVKSLKDTPARMSTLIANESNKKIHLHKKIESMQEVIHHEDIYDLLYQHPNEIAVMNCMCRLIRESNGHNCDYDMGKRVCLCIGDFSKQLIKYDIGEPITLQEAVDIVTECALKGAIHTIYHYGMNSENEEIFICNCCKDCCFLYGSVQNGAISNINVKAHYISNILNVDQCIKCKQCIKYCPTDALSIKHDTITLEKERCIGCGQCLKRCKKDVFEIKHDIRKVFVKTRRKQYAN